MNVVSINISGQRGTIKEPVSEVIVDKKGIVGDAHAGSGHRQISMLGEESIKHFSADMNRRFKYGEFAENITSSGIDLSKVSVLDRIKINDVELEISQIGKKCHGSGCEIFKSVGKCVMPQDGVFLRVINGGQIKKGDKIILIPKTLKFLIITVSDRASSGDYVDESGPKICKLLGDYFSDKRWHTEYKTLIVPDEKEDLEIALKSAVKEGIDIVITTGGTGISPSDITPEVVVPMCDKIIPGIMENIRLKYGTAMPSALLSRGVAGVMRRSLVYTLPGSVNAVSEYMNEILKVMEHQILMINGLGH